MNSTEGTSATAVGGSALSEGLGPLLPKREVLSVVAEWALAGHITERGVTCEAGDAIRAAVAAEVAAERERMIADGWRQTRYAAPVTDCEACLTSDACAIRGQCGHYLRERA